MFFRLQYLLAVLALFAVGCGSDDPVSPQEEHFEAEGLVLIDSGNRFFRYFQGQIDAGGGRMDHLQSPIGLTAHWSVKFLDGNGNEIDPPNDPDYTFGWDIADTSIVEVVQDPGDEGKFEFHLRGLKAGETTIRLLLNHDGHADFRTVPLPVHVDFEAEGLVLIDSGNRFFRYFQGQIDAGGGRMDHLQSPIGLTAHWSVKFLDGNGNEIDPPNDPDYTLGWDIADTSIVEVVQDPGEEGKFEFHLRGLKAGETTMRLLLNHDGHADFRTVPLPVHVAP